MAKCDVCDKESDTLIDDGFWHQRVCEKHYKSNGAPRCDSCFRFLKETNYLDLTDGRKLCSDCSSIAIMDPRECKPLIQYAHEFYRSLNLKMDEGIRVLLLDKNSLHIFKWDINDLRGTVWFSSDMLRAVRRIKTCTRTGGSIKMERKEETVRRRKKLTSRGRSSTEIEALIVQFGMPDVDTGATVAHEMMHAWLYLKGVDGLERRVEEGFCELMSYMWMEWFCSNGADSFNKTSEQVQYTRKLKEFIDLSMEDSKDEIYGQGFRDAKKAVDKFGFKAVLNHILIKRCLPQ